MRYPRRSRSVALGHARLAYQLALAQTVDPISLGPCRALSYRIHAAALARFPGSGTSSLCAKRVIAHTDHFGAAVLALRMALAGLVQGRWKQYCTNPLLSARGHFAARVPVRNSANTDLKEFGNVGAVLALRKQVVKKKFSIHFHFFPQNLLTKDRGSGKYAKPCFVARSTRRKKCTNIRFFGC